MVETSHPQNRIYRSDIPFPYIPISVDLGGSFFHDTFSRNVREQNLAAALAAQGLGGIMAFDEGVGIQVGIRNENHT